MVVNKTHTYEILEDDICMHVCKDIETGDSIHLPSEFEDKGEVSDAWKHLGVWKIKSVKL